MAIGMINDGGGVTEEQVNYIVNTAITNMNADKRLGMVQAGDSFPAANKNEWIEIGSDGQVDGIDVLTGEWWMCTEDATPEATPAKWFKLKTAPSSGGGSTGDWKFYASGNKSGTSSSITFPENKAIKIEFFNLHTNYGVKIKAVYNGTVKNITSIGKQLVNNNNSESDSVIKKTNSDYITVFDDAKSSYHSLKFYPNNQNNFTTFDVKSITFTDTPIATSIIYSGGIQSKINEIIASSTYDHSYDFIVYTKDI